MLHPRPRKRRMTAAGEIHEARDYFPNARGVDGDRLYRSPPLGAPTAADLLLKVLNDAHARLRSPSWAAHRVACIDAQIAELVRERERVISDVQ